MITFLARAIQRNRMIIASRGVLLALQLVTCHDAASQALPANQPTPMDQQREIALALSSCPTTIADKAGVYVLEPSGYAKVRESQNGFIAIVQHSVPGAQEPQCMDAEGTRVILPRILKVAEWRAQGKSPDEIRRLVGEAFAKGVFQPPSRVGIDYMLSTENVVPDDHGVIAPFPPHVMFYAPFLTNADIGSAGQAGGGPAFVAAQGTPYALIIVPIPTETQPSTSHHHQ
ncbi:MAG: hypothetical protein JO134_05300 [Xanthobacteraceae bacterium]|nr:hypothetical protein [Xanthobacteraceae bacterium]